jgi:hypothetical protein
MSYIFQKTYWVFSHDTRLVPNGYHRKFWGKQMDYFYAMFNPWMRALQNSRLPQLEPQGPLFLVKPGC